MTASHWATTIFLVTILCLTASAHVILYWSDRFSSQDFSPESPDEENDDDPDAALALMAYSGLLGTGMSHARALTSLAESVRGPVRHELLHAVSGLSLGLSWDEAWAKIPAERLSPVSCLLRDVLSATASSGAPGRSVVRRAASSFRQSWTRTAEAQAERAGVQLLVPLAVCFLPAFMILGVGTFALSLARGVWGSAL